MKNLGLSLQNACEGLGITIEEYERAKQKKKDDWNAIQETLNMREQ